MLREYSICALTRNLGDEISETTNPFTGEVIKSYIDKGLTSEERLALEELFDEVGLEMSDSEPGSYERGWGSQVCLTIRDLYLDKEYPVRNFTLEVITDELTSDILSILMNIAKSGNLAFASCAGEDPCVVESSATDDEKSRWGEISVIIDNGALAGWLNNTLGFREVSA